MNTKLEQFPGTYPNPVLSVAKDGTVIYSNEAGKPLLQEWGVEIGEILPSSIKGLVQRVLYHNSPEKMEVNVVKSIYLVVFHPLPEQECVSISGFNISDQKELEENVQESDALEMCRVELSEVIDIQAVKPIMEDLYKLVHIPIGINDLKGNVLAGVGWQEICTKFHRIHPEASKHCIESDTKLSTGVVPGKFKLYKCKNNIYDIVTPIMVGDLHVGYVFGGQFFFEDEPIDYELFRSQARKYGFNEGEYIESLKKVPRLTREAMETGMSLFMKFANLLSKLSYSNVKLAKSLSESDTLLEALQKSESKYRQIIETANEGVWVFNSVSKTAYVNEKMAEMLGYSREEMAGSFIWDYASEEDKDFFQVRLANIRQGIDEVYECKLLRKNGSPVWLLVSAKASFDKDGKFVGSLGMFTDITERKKAEEALRLSNLYNRSLIEVSLDPLVIIGNDGNVTDVNKATEQATGYSRNDLIGTYFAFYLTEPDQAISAFIHVCTHGELRDYALEIKHRDGHITPVLCNASVYRDENCKVIGVFVAARDITERKNAEKALEKAHNSLEERVKERTAELERAYILLKESEGRLAEAQRIANLGNWDWNIETNGLYWSDEIYRIFGRSPQEFGATYDAFLSYVHPDDRDYVDNAVKEALNGKSYSIDHRIILANGKERVVHEQGEVIFNEKNIPIRMMGTVQDITESKKAEEKIKMLADVVESSNDTIVTRTLDGIITSWNKGAEQMHGYSAEEILGKKITILEPDDHKGELSRLAEKVKHGEKIKNYETVRLKKDDTQINVSITLSPVFDSSGKLIAISTIARDITNRIKAEKALEKTEEARRKEIHHRIKNNLQVISSLLDLQADKFRDREVVEAFRESQNRVISMSLIHEELYEGVGTDTLDFSGYLQKLAENLFHTYDLGKKNIRLCMNLEENAFYNMDISVPLGIIVNELVSNSLKHAFPGRSEGEIQIKLCKEENEECKTEGRSTTFVLTVSDNGVGIPENIDIEDLKSLGLQLVTTLVDQLDGELEMKRNNGTEFNVRFMVTEKNNQASAPVANNRFNSGIT